MCCAGAEWFDGWSAPMLMKMSRSESAEKGGVENASAREGRWLFERQPPPPPGAPCVASRRNNNERLRALTSERDN